MHLRRSRMELMYLRCCLLLQYQIQRGAREEPGTFVMGRLVRSHTPRLVVSHSTCPPLSPSTLANSFIMVLQ